MSHPHPPSLPTGSITPDQCVAYLSRVQQWSAETGARLLDLDAGLGTLPQKSKQDHTLAFVIWQAVDQRIVEANEHPSAFPDKRLEPLRGPVTTRDGTNVATGIDEALLITCALIDATQVAIDTHQGTLAATATIHANLAAAAPLVKSLSSSAGLHSQLLQQAASPDLEADSAALGRLASEVTALLADLQRADQERTKLLQELPNDAQKVEVLRTLEADARRIAETSIAKVLNQPKLGIVSVDALGSAPNISALQDTPWPSQRASLVERATKLARAEASLRHVIATHSALLAERNELRQVVDAFRTKAMAGRIGELPPVSAAYEQAKKLLWSAPTDLIAARSAVSQYQATVSSHMATTKSISSQSSPPGRPASEVPR